MGVGAAGVRAVGSAPRHTHPATLTASCHDNSILPRQQHPATTTVSCHDNSILPRHIHAAALCASCLVVLILSWSEHPARTHMHRAPSRASCSTRIILPHADTPLCAQHMDILLYACLHFVMYMNFLLRSLVAASLHSWSPLPDPTLPAVAAAPRTSAATGTAGNSTCSQPRREALQLVVRSMWLPHGGPQGWCWWGAPHGCRASGTSSRRWVEL